MNEYLLHDKLKSLERERNAIQNFLDYLDEQRVQLVKYHGEHTEDCYHTCDFPGSCGNLFCTAEKGCGEEYTTCRTDEYFTWGKSKSDIIAEFLGIDQKELEKEKAAILENFVASQT